MDLKTKRKAEIEEQKDRRKEEVIAAAIKVFKEKGIEKTKMTDIAECAEVGVASVYRYFKTKTEIAIAAAIGVWQEMTNIYYADFIKEDYKSLKGIQQVERVLEIFLNVYINHKEFMRFIEEFDNYVIREGISRERLQEYEKYIISLAPVMMEAMEAGKRDGSISTGINNAEFYMTITHTLISLSQKLIMRNAVLDSDSIIDGEGQIKLVINMALKYINSEN